MALVLGGIRSGKSQYAEQIAAGFGEKILYVAVLKAGSRWNVPVM